MEAYRTPENSIQAPQGSGKVKKLNLNFICRRWESIPGHCGHRRRDQPLYQRQVGVIRCCLRNVKTTLCALYYGIQWISMEWIGIQWNSMELNAHWNSTEWNAHALECASGYVGVCGGKCWESVLGNVERKIAIRAAIRNIHLGRDFCIFCILPQIQPFPPKISCSFQWYYRQFQYLWTGVHKVMQR